MRLIDADALLLEIGELKKSPWFNDDSYPGFRAVRKEAVEIIEDLCIKDAPTIQPSLYGYKIEHLAYIAKVMEKEGVTVEYAVRTFDDMSRVIKMIIGEIQQKVEEALNE